MIEILGKENCIYLNFTRVVTSEIRNWRSGFLKSDVLHVSREYPHAFHVGK